MLKVDCKNTFFAMNYILPSQLTYTAALPGNQHN